MVLMMFTGYLVGFTAFRALFSHNAVMVILFSSFISILDISMRELINYLGHGIAECCWGHPWIGVRYAG